MSSNNFLKGHGCPKCRLSSPEKYIYSILTNHNIKFEQQKSFEGCVYKKKLKFDFYLIDHHLCLEFDGQQHFTPIKGYEELKRVQVRDGIKNQFCKDSNIHLIRIRGFKNIEPTLMNLIYPIMI